jgi:hypothetical protein
MPKSLEPGESFEIWLDSDAVTPKETRPVFLCKTQSMRGQRKLCDAYDRFYDPASNESVNERFDFLVDVVSEIVVGWRNMGGVEYSRDAIDAVLSHAEALEVIRKVGYNRPSHEEKKSSE